VAGTPAKTEHEARQRYVEGLSQSLSCITKAIWVTVRPLAGPNDYWTLHLSSASPGAPIRMERGGGGYIHLTALQRFRPRRVPETGAWRMRTMEYSYTLWESTADRALKPLIQWHFHPESGSTDRPHLHVRAADEMWGMTTRKLHIPSDRVAFESVVRFVVDELGVSPRHADWEKRVDEALGRFVAYRSWTSIPPPAL
jgi:hypothetical protein